MVVALEFDERRVRRQLRDLSSVLVRHRGVTPSVEHEDRALDLRDDVADVPVHHLDQQITEALRRRGEALVAAVPLDVGLVVEMLGREQFEGA